MKSLKTIQSGGNGTVYICDLDGTLLGSDSRLSPYTSSVISRLTNLGATITVCTARTPATVVPIFAGTVTDAPMGVFTGASFWDRDNASLFNTNFIPPDEASRIYNGLIALGLCPFLYTLPEDRNGEGPVIEVYTPSATLIGSSLKFYSERSRLKLKHFNLGERPENYSCVVLVLVLGPSALLANAVDGILNSSECKISFYPDIQDPGESVIEVLPPGVSKGSAVKEIKRMTGAGRAVVFGDNLNDLDMFEAGDMSVAVDNAVEGLKQKADLVIGSNTEDSVARFIARDFLGKEL